MPQKRKVYILTEGHEVQDKSTFSSLKKISNRVGEENNLPSYHVLAKGIARAKKEDGVYRFQSNDGKAYTIEVKDIE